MLSCSSLAVDCRLLFASGIGRYLREILSRMPENLRSFTAYCNNSDQLVWLRERFPDAKLILEHDTIYGVREQFLRAWRLRKCSVFWSPHYNFIIYSNLKQIVTVHDLAHLALPDIFGRGAKRIYARFFLGAVAKKAAQVIFISEFTRREFAGHIGAPQCPSLVIPNGVDNRWFNSRYSVRESFYLYVGNIKPHKNLEKLAAAFSCLPDAASRHLIIVGKKEGFITGINSGLDFGGTLVTFTGDINDAQLMDLYGKARALIFPSIYEGFGLPPLEAMASGCPVLASNAASIPEVCGADYSTDAGGNVLYFDPFDHNSIAVRITAFEAMGLDSVNAMTSNARKHAYGYSWDRTAKATWDVITSELESSTAWHVT